MSKALIVVASKTGIVQYQGDLGRVELYAETVELHKQWLKHLLIAAGPDEALLVEAGCSHLVETASANKLAESQAGDEKEYGLPAIMVELHGKWMSQGSEEALPDMAKLQSLVHDKGCQLLVQQLQRVMPQEDDVFQAVSQLSQVHNVLATDVSAAAELAQSGHLVDAKLADFGRKVAACQKTMEFCKTEIRGKLAEQPGFGAVPDLVKDKEKAEHDLNTLLASFKHHAQRKIELCQQRQKHNASLQKVLQAAEASAASKTELATSFQQWSLEHAKGENTRQMTACQRLVTAYAATKCAREQLQACLEQE
ncbi:TPA: hypothetical protein ACH3X3_010869 [Trebouxia sp. C0006]